MLSTHQTSSSLGSLDVTTTSDNDQNGNTARRNNMKLSYPNWEQDKAIAEQYFAQNGASNGAPRPGSSFYKKIQAMVNKQALHEGDRSHPDMVALENEVFSYDGWEQDKQDAIKIHSGECSVLYLGSFAEKLELMRRKERIHHNRHSFDALRELDELHCTYDGAQADLAIAERLFMDHPESALFHKKVTAMAIKQKVLVEGDKSHPDLVALESQVFSYDGWQADKEEAMQRILGDCCLLFLGEFAIKFDEMKRKEQAFRDRTLVEELQYLERLPLDYPGWEYDKASAERLYLEYFCSSSASDATTSLFHRKVQCMQTKQRLHDGDRSDPNIRALDATQFSYEGWQDDKQEAEQRLTGDCILLHMGSSGFQDVFAKMKNKELMHTNRRNLRGLQNLDSLLLHNRNQQENNKASDTDETASISSCSTAAGEEEVDEQKNNTCVVCFEAEPSHAYIPCGHRCICSDCAELQYASSCDSGTEMKCPICREPTVCVTRIFL
ncbi:expressed unknown protein [Seminavis robusta]|uniref:RING-type domain-containing protein n=1 Tax=Seminavis robusta TaxID=568900 RepID=A0A9N8E5T4_9STRA|nr:expressed unknown protein [Seminavis robusta]|eukprot:Sro701_g189840.1 n/a (496) ;mRNA; f:39307-40794